MNKIYRILWSKRINGWVVASEHATSSKTKSNIKSNVAKWIFGTLIPFTAGGAYAADECGPATSGSSVTCTGLDTGNVSYYDKNIELTVDGTTNGSVILSNIVLNNALWNSGTTDDHSLSLTTSGPVSIIGTNDQLISIRKSSGGGSVSLNLGSDTLVSQTSSNWGNTAIDIFNSDYSPHTQNVDTTVFIDKGAKIVVDGERSPTAINAYHVAAGNLFFNNKGSIEVSSSNPDSAYMQGINVYVYALSGSQVENHGEIVLKNTGTNPIYYASALNTDFYAYNYDEPYAATVINTGNITGDHRYADDAYCGINAFFTGSEKDSNFVVENSGNITGVTYGIQVGVNGAGTHWNLSDPNAVTAGIAKHSGTIEAEKTGILMNGLLSEELTVQTSGKIVTAAGNDTKGIYITSSSGGLVGLGRVLIESGSEIYDHGVGGETAAIAVDKTVEVDISVSGKVRSHKGAGISMGEAPREYVAVGPSGAPPYMLEAGKSIFDVVLRNGAEVVGGYSSAGIVTKGGNHLNVTLDKGAELEATSDVAIKAEKETVESFDYWADDGSGNWDIHVIPEVEVDAAPVRLKNAGTITGTLQFGSQADTITIEPTGVWNVRNFADTDGDGIRDTKAVAVSDFGSGGDVFVNLGTVRLGTVSSPSTTNTTGEYLPTGALSASNEDIVHAQFLNLQRFENAGTIDLTANNKAGDVLVITGGDVAGVNGGGTYVSNGGTIKLNTLISNDSNLSDVVVLDNVKLGTGLTKIHVVPTMDSSGGVTVGNGIKLVEVLGAENASAFTLSGPVVQGPYEYVLGNGLDASTANNLYLRNIVVLDDIIVQPLPSPDAGSILSNQHIGSLMFNMNNVVRAGAGNTIGSISDRPNQDLWVKVNHTNMKGYVADDLKTDINTTIVQIGADLYKSPAQNYLLGVYGGYGMSDQDTKSAYTGSRASGKVKGYQIGVYGSWEPSAIQGLYIDAWGYYAKFNNTFNSAAYASPSTDYDGKGYAVATEVGYKIKLSERADGGAWYVIPNARIGYASSKANSFYDSSSKTHYSGLKSSGVQTQLGARMYIEAPKDSTGWAGMSPYAELNWISNQAQSSVTIERTSKMNGKFGKNIGEVRVGVNARVANNLTLWGDVSMQRGNSSYKRHSIEAGLSWSF